MALQYSLIYHVRQVEVCKECCNRNAVGAEEQKYRKSWQIAV
jgi:hypothetical protein